MPSKFLYSKSKLDLLLPPRFSFALSMLDDEKYRQDIGVVLTRILILHEMVEHILKYNLQLRGISYPKTGNKGHNIWHLYNLFDDEFKKDLQLESEKLEKGIYKGEVVRKSTILDICKASDYSFHIWRYEILSDDRPFSNKIISSPPKMNKRVDYYELSLLFISAVNLSDLSFYYFPKYNSKTNMFAIQNGWK